MPNFNPDSDAQGSVGLWADVDRRGPMPFFGNQDENNSPTASFSAAAAKTGANNLVGNQFQTPLDQDIRLTSIWATHHTNNSVSPQTFQMAVYEYAGIDTAANRLPGDLVVASDIVVRPQSPDIIPREYPIPAGGFIPPRGVYLVPAFRNPDISVAMTNTAGGSPVSYSSISDAAAFNDPWGGTVGSTTSNNWAMWVEYEFVTTPVESTVIVAPDRVGGPMYSYDFFGTSAEIEALGFLNGLANWASLLKTGDVILIRSTDATKIYNLTVQKETRTITLSTGLVIA